MILNAPLFAMRCVENPEKTINDKIENYLGLYPYQGNKTQAPGSCVKIPEAAGADVAELVDALA